MEFHQIRYFLAASRHGNLTSAAKACKVSQPLLSQQIAKLEAQLGERLFDRSRKGVSLSQFGEGFFKHAVEIAQSIKSAQDYVVNYSGSIQGVVRIGAIPTIAPYLIPRIVVETKRRFPDLQLEVFEYTTERLIEAMARRDVDFAILSPPYKEGSELDAYHLLKDEILLATSAKHSLAKQKSISFNSLLDQSFIMMTKEHCMSSQAMSFCESKGVTPNVIMKSSQLETTLALVEAGSGITVMPRMAIPSHSHRKLKLSSFSPKPLFRDIEIVWRVRNPLSKVQESFLAMVKELHS